MNVLPRKTEVRTVGSESEFISESTAEEMTSKAKKEGRYGVQFMRYRRYGWPLEFCDEYDLVIYEGEWKHDPWPFKDGGLGWIAYDVDGRTQFLLNIVIWAGDLLAAIVSSEYILRRKSAVDQQKGTGSDRISS